MMTHAIAERLPRFAGFLLTLVALFAIATACGDANIRIGAGPGQACENGACPDGQTCYRDKCYAHCAAATDCPSNARCYDGRCMSMDCSGVSCEAGESCHQGVCYPSCDEEDDCEGQTRCFAGSCVPTSCEHIDCPGDQVCHQGVCYPDHPGCDDTSDCPAGDHCRQGQCESLCQSNLDCPEPLLCVDPCAGEASCNEPRTCRDPNPCAGVTCPQGKRCADGQCVDPCPEPNDGTCFNSCWTSDDCKGTERCFQGQCVPLDCGGVSCSPGEVCDRGGCVLECQTSAECPGEGRCRNGACEDLCDEVRCPGGQTCSQGVCYDTCTNGCPDAHVCVRRQGAPNYCSPLSCEGVRCPEGGACYRGRCKLRCENDDECPGSETCATSQNPRVCIGACDEVVCAGDTHCHEGQCYRECAYQQDCPDAHYCHYSGLCLPGTCPDCSDGTVCNENTFECTLCSQVDRVWPTWEDCWMSTCRVATSVAMSRARFPSGVRTAVLALGAESETGAGVDAMSGGPLAYQLGAPILLTAHSQLSWSTAQELQRLKNAPTPLERVVILGGPFAISNAVENALKAMGLTVERVFGHTRMDTSLEVAKALNPNPTIVFLADAWVLDGHLASGVAAALGAPVLLTDTDELTDVIAAYLEQHRSTIVETVVIGTTEAIPDAVVAQIPTPTRRITGPNQYAVSASIADYAIERGVDPSHVYVTEGMTLFDALSAGATGRILLISERACLKNRPCSDLNTLSTAYRFLEEQNVARVTLVGTGSALSPQVERDACAAIFP